ncbi:MAG TPA: glycosyltransferase family 4 protein [Dehalococcoidia bacterium]|nr:glycosyltransferase family 4 protein [Dehalococcoidia bacterium]
MRVLFLTSHFPFPPDSGAALKTWSVYEHLRKSHELSGIAIARDSLTPTQQAYADQAHIRTVTLKKGRSVSNLIRSYFRRLPLSVERNRSDQVQSLVEEQLKADLPAAVFVDGWLMAQYLPDWFPGLKLLHEHNAEYRVWQREAAERGRGITGTLLRREAGRVRSYEASILHRFDVVFAVSEDDRRSLAVIGGESTHYDVLHNIPDPALLARPSLSFAATEPLIFYFGTLSWQPNIDGLERLITNILPGVLERIPEARLAIAGRGAPDSIVALASGKEAIDLVGELGDDAEEWYARARVFVEATKTGGGTRLKVLNALARGLPVVASVQAAQGLDVVPGDHLMIARSDGEMIDDIVRLMTDAARWRVLSENGRALVRGKYVAEIVFTALDRVLTSSGQPPASAISRRRGRR